MSSVKGGAVSLGNWVEKTPGEWRRHWIHIDALDVDDDVAAIVTVTGREVDWRAFSPGQQKRVRQGKGGSPEEALSMADRALRALRRRNDPI